MLKTILGGILAGSIASAAVADPANRPISRDDAAQIHAQEKLATLAAFRVVARPDHMIRYPVQVVTSAPTMRPQARDRFVPRTRWDANGGSKIWTRTAMAAVGSDGAGLDSVVPRDIATWCPAYADNSSEMRSAFWVGMMSALSKHESTYNPRAVGGGGRWFGLLQIYPDTARRYGCRATTGEGLMNPVDNLSCAARIMAVTVKRDRAVALRDSRWRGVAADWGPMTKPGMIAEMSNWTARQSYCQPVRNTRPQARPNTSAWTVTASTKGF
ncbi:transglycosylase SLT domain-containing protein [Yoonia sp. MH D7]